MFTLNQNNFLKHEVDVNPAFDADNSRIGKTAKLKSWAITLALHAALLLLFYWIVIHPPFPPLSESGVFLNLGIADEGSGIIQPEGNAAALQAPVPEASTPVTQQAVEEKILTEDTKEDVPVIQQKDDKKQKPQPEKKQSNTATNKKEQPVAAPPKPKALYPGSTPNASTGEGNGQYGGDMGKPNGDLHGTDYSGNPGVGNGGPGGMGNGGSPQLGMSGRKIIFFPPISDPSQKTGLVVVNIKVDQSGNVIYAKATQRGSTTTDNYLFHLAEEAALKTRVNADPSAAEEQFGTITYSFRVK